MGHCLEHSFFYDMICHWILLILYFLLRSLDHHFGSSWRSLGSFWQHFGDRVGHRCTQRKPGRSQDGFLMMTESALERWTLFISGRSLYVKGGLGGNRSGIYGIGICFHSFFGVFFYCGSKSLFYAFQVPFGVLWGHFQRLFQVSLEIMKIEASLARKPQFCISD